MSQLGAGWTKSPRPVLRGRSAARQRCRGPLLTHPLTLMLCLAHKIWDTPLEAALLENLKDRNPVHAGRFRRHRSDLDLLQPIRQTVQIAGEASK